MFEFQSVLFQGDALLQAIADDQDEQPGVKARISKTRHQLDLAVGKVQTALLDWRPDSLPTHGADGEYGSETATAVHRFKREELGVAEGEIIDDVGPLTVQRLDAIRAAHEQPPAPIAFVRRDAWSMQTPANPFDPITLAYAKAIQTMQARPASDPTSWTFQAAIHGSYAQPPAGAAWNECQHHGWFFLPWHRLYLFFFESIVRAAVLAAGGPADFAIPYWNYEKPGPADTLPPAFLTPTLPDGSSNPLFQPAPQRSTGIATGSPVNPLATSSVEAMALVNFSAPPGPGIPSFGGGRVGPARFGGSLGALETTPHNAMHRQIGGTQTGQCQGGLMIDDRCAARDPIFWLHHANVDRLWVEWLSRGGGRANPSDAGWLSQRFTFYDETGAQVMRTVGDSLDTAGQLGYVYDVLPSVVVPPPAPVPTPPSPFRLVAASEAPLELSGASETTPLAAPEAELETFRTALETIADGATQVTLSVEDIAGAEDPGVDYAIFLNVPSGAEGEERRRHHIGNVTFFGLQRDNDADRPHDGAPGFRHTFDVTATVSALLEAGLFDPTSVEVTFEPIALPGEDQAAAEAGAAPVEIGRVSLFVG